MKPNPLPFFSALLATCATSFAATAVNLGPTADAFLSAANATGNFGGAGAFGVSASGLDKGEFQSLLMFDFSPAKTQFDTTYGSGGWVVDSVSLQLTAANPNNAIFNASAAGLIALRWLADDTWSEGSGTPAAPGAAGVTFSSLPGLLASGSESLGSHAFDGATSGAVSIQFQPAGGFLTDINAGGTATVNLFAGDSAVSGLFNSRSNGTPANRPLLTITASAIPEPGAWALAAFSAVMLISRRRRNP